MPDNIQNMLENSGSVILKFVRKYQIIGAIVGFIVATILGTGSVWSFLESRNASDNTKINLLHLAEELRTKQLEIHSQISEAIPGYISARDEWLRFKTGATISYERQNEIFISRTRLVELINNYNLLEAEMSALHETSPRFFDIQKITPPMAPRIEGVEETEEQTRVHVRLDEDPVLIETRDYLIQLLKE